jgi:hypothetical protein
VNVREIKKPLASLKNEYYAVDTGTLGSYEAVILGPFLTRKIAEEAVKERTEFWAAHGATEDSTWIILTRVAEVGATLRSSKPKASETEVEVTA